MAAVRRLVLGAGVVCAIANPGAQTPAPAPAATTVSGTVVERASRRPMGGAVVSLYSVASRSTPVQFEGEGGGLPEPGTWFQTSSVLTGADGRFRFVGVPPGAYELSTWKARWIPAAWESADPQMTGAWMAISQSMRAIEATVPMDPAPVVRGRLIDQHGDVVPWIRVTAFRRDLYARNHWQDLGSRATDDRGMFSMVFNPGEVIVRVQPPRPVSGRTTTPMQARTLQLRPGDRQEIDFRLEPVPAYRVSGQVVGVQTPANLRLRLIPVDSGLGIDPNGEADHVTAARPDGRFAFPATPAGRYLLRAIEVPYLMTSSHGIPALERLPAEPTLAAEAAVQLTDRDVDLTLTLQAGVRISGRVEFDGQAAPEALARLRQIPILLHKVDDTRMDVRGLFSSPETFVTMQVTPGRYVMRTFAPQGWVLRSIVHDGRDIADEPLEVGASDVTGVVITFGSARSILSGDVPQAVAQRQRPWVIAFPSDRRLWAQYWATPRRVRIARLGTAGTYQFELIPGGYFVCAVDDQPVALTPEVFEKLSSGAVRVVISEGDRLTQTLPWSPRAVRR